MALNRTHIDAPPVDVFRVLADARSYEHWVVGCADIRAVSGDWPAPGSCFHHTVGLGPFKVKDSTKAIEVELGRRLTIEARARPAGVALVTFTLEPAEEGTTVTIEERAVRGLARTLANPVLDALIHLRNAETLRRLEKQVHQRQSAS